MVGRPMRKVFCSGRTRAGLREGKIIPCKMKGYPLSDGKTFRCKYHGLANLDKFNKAKYTDQTRINQLRSLKQFKNYTDEQLKEYYDNKVKPRISKRERSVYHRRKARVRSNPYRDPQFRRQPVSVQLDEILCLLKKKSKSRK